MGLSMKIKQKLKRAAFHKAALSYINFNKQQRRIDGFFAVFLCSRKGVPPAVLSFRRRYGLNS
jgi:hypothetical protein